MLRLTNHVQHYPWGTRGSNSYISKFLETVEEDKPYAELWLGTHPSLPSQVSSSLLEDHVGELPYLMKVLSVSMPLSIQVHPDAVQARILHTFLPDTYDSNYKVEMFYALSDFHLLLGFKTDEEILQLLSETPELASIVGEFSSLKKALESIYENEANTRSQTEAFLGRISVEQPSHYCLSLNVHFPCDAGIFFSLFMNYCVFQEGQAVLIPPGTPHSYLFGNCIECMSCSDNVVRAGLTPKYKDVKTLLGLLDFTTRGRFSPLVPEYHDNIAVIRTPYPDFELKVIRSSAELIVNRPAIILAVEGSADLSQGSESLRLSEGQSVVLTANTSIRTDAPVVFFICQERSNS